MTARFRRFLNTLGETFWLVPAALVVLGILLAVGLLRIDRAGTLPSWLAHSTWIYNGGGTGATSACPCPCCIASCSAR